VKTTTYPVRPDMATGLSPGRPKTTAVSAMDAEELAKRCPTRAIDRQGAGMRIDHGRCIHCFRCHPGSSQASPDWETGYEWAALGGDAETGLGTLDAAFGRSLHVRFVDAGACGACMSEARQLNNPYYNMHRLGFFTTPTPRNADVLLVAGPVSDAMRLPLRRTWEAMPPPKRIVAIGACAISGGVFGPSFAAAGGVQDIIPVDVVVPGCPPPPLAILHALLVAVGRKPPVKLVSGAGQSEGAQ
jgi:Ni,Fe-hydrogenase III small subunit